MQTISLKQYEYKEVEIESKEIELPTETQYFFETGIRRAIRIKPVWTTWNKKQYDKEEEIFQYLVTFVYGSFEAKIEKYTIQVSRLQEYYFKRSGGLHDFVTTWLDGDLNKRTQEKFESDFAQVLKDINE